MKTITVVKKNFREAIRARSGTTLVNSSAGKYVLKFSGCFTRMIMIKSENVNLKRQ
jgi:hypothetical protein